MRTVFVDTSFYLALINADDDFHPAAVRIQQTQRALLLTTEYVLVEFLDRLSRRNMRRRAHQAFKAILADPVVNLVPASSDLFSAGHTLYSKRPDKEWGITDCISFIVMQQQGLTEALTSDHHFEQAGFKALLR